MLTYRDYKYFSNESFRSDVLNEIGRYNDFSFTDLNSMFPVVLNKHASIKKRTLRLIKKTSWIKNLIKLLWLDLNFATNLCRIKN